MRVVQRQPTIEINKQTDKALPVSNILAVKAGTRGIFPEVWPFANLRQ